MANEHPLRVPSVVPGRWVYLRTWTDYHTYQERTWANNIYVCTAFREKGTVRVEGLPEFTCNEGSTAANMDAIDRWLISLGAEEVPSSEWPDNCVGATSSDRIPYGQSDADLDLWVDWVREHAPGRRVW